MPEDFIPKVGDYAMHHMFCKDENATLVQVNSEHDGRFGISYVPSGGASFSWPAKEFRPVTDPIMLAAVNAHKARQRIGFHETQKQKAISEAAKWDGVVEVLKEGIKEV
jgi:hypothetical protein